MGFKIKINGEDAWESEGDHALVESVTIRSAQGEAGKLSVPNSMQECDVIVVVRDTLENEPLDMRDRRMALERGEEIEELSADRVTEGRQQQEEADRAAEEEEQAAEVENEENVGPEPQPEPEPEPEETQVQQTDSDADRNEPISL